MAAYVDSSLLLHFDGADGSTTFTDDSPQSQSVTVAGGAEIDTSQSKFGGSSGRFPSTSSYGAVIGDPSLTVGAGDFCFETFIYHKSGVSGGPQYLIASSIEPGTSPSVARWVFLVLSGELSLQVVDEPFAIYFLPSGLYPAEDAWTHVMAGRRSGNLFVGSAGTIVDGDPCPVDITADDIYFGGRTYGDPGVEYWLDEARFTTGDAIYSGATYTVPTTPYDDSLSVDAVVSVAGPLGDPLAEAYTQAALASAPGPLSTPQASALNDFAGLIGSAKEVYTLEVGGLTVPMSSWQATLQTGRKNYLQAVIQNATSLAASIASAAGEDIVVYREATYQGVTLRTEMARAPVESIVQSTGPFRDTIVVSGYSDAFESGQTGARVLEGVRSRYTTNSGAVRVRCNIDWYLRPGQTASDDGDEFEVAYIKYYVPAVGDSYMDVGTRGAG